MANGNTHRVVAALVAGGVVASSYVRADNAQAGVKVLEVSALAAAFTNLPDYLEPAVNPNHRAFFHSLAFAGLVGYGMHKVYDWSPDTPLQEIARLVLLVGGGAILTHLALDALTPRSLPILGA